LPANPFNGCGHAGFRPAIDNNCGAFLGQSCGDRQPDASGRSDNDGKLPLQTQIHCPFPCRANLLQQFN
jgi:hypothetical protein